MQDFVGFVKDEAAYRNMLQNRIGSTPFDLFWDQLEAFEELYKAACVKLDNTKLPITPDMELAAFQAW